MTSSRSSAALRHGVFLAPFHQMHENPTLCLERDFELLELIDTLGYAEAWIGEHHSAGFETISSPELFIAAAAVRTKHLRLGTGVISLPYHNPLMVANRLIQLDHQTRGRLMFGAGPGLLASDALMLGIDPAVQRDRMAEALDVILRLMQGETVTEKTEWYTLEEAKVNFLPYSYPYPETVVASAVTPSGGRLAGKYNLGMLAVAAAENSGFNALDANWGIANEIAAENGRTMDESGLRVVMPMHIADTREQARANVRFGIQQFVDYFNNNLPRIFVPEGVDVVDHFIDNKMAVIGTPDDAIAMIERLYDKQPFGCMLFQSNNWADWEQTKRSYELYARYVIPHFKGVNRTRYWSYEWITEHQKSLTEMRTSAAQAMFDKHEAEQKAKQAAAEIARPKTGKEAW
ncbi:MAG: LLM class flavin-dependent oxidoreductase [Acidimicrobiia bacterium]